MHSPTVTAMVLLLGVLSGVLTTLAGLGGGMLLLLAIALLSSPQTALAVTAPALLLSNLHRAWVYRAHIARPVAVPFALGALPGSVLGAFALVVMTEIWRTYQALAAARTTPVKPPPARARA